MASCKPLPDTNNITKKYGQQHIPVTPSPLNPRSNSGGSRPASLPRRHTVSGSTPARPAAAAISETAAATTPIIPPRPAIKHSRRHSGSSVSLTERLMRYKGALAWRSATTSATFRRNTLQGPRPELDGGNTATATAQGGLGSNDTRGAEGTTPAPESTTPSTNHHNEKADFHVVVLNHPPKELQPEARAKEPRSPLSYHPVEYYNYHCTDYTTTSTRAIFRRPRQGPSYGGQGMYYGYSSTGSTTMLQHASFMAVALLLGVCIIFHALSLVFGYGSGLSMGVAGGERNSSWESSQGYYR